MFQLVQGAIPDFFTVAGINRFPQDATNQKTLHPQRENIPSGYLT
jgi:hypothetical protein